MVYLALWLILGCVGYMIALAYQIEYLKSEIQSLKNGEDPGPKKNYKWHTQADYLRGLACILLGPLCIALIMWLNGGSGNEL